MTKYHSLLMNLSNIAQEAEEDAAEPSAADVPSRPVASPAKRDPRLVSKPVAAAASAPKGPAQHAPAAAMPDAQAAAMTHKQSHEGNQGEAVAGADTLAAGLPVAQAAALAREHRQGDNQGGANAVADSTAAGLLVAQSAALAREQRQSDSQGRADTGADPSAAGLPVAQAAASEDKQCREHLLRKGAAWAQSLGADSSALGMLSLAEGLTNRSTPTGRTKKQARKLTNSLERLRGAHEQLSGCEGSKVSEPAASATLASSEAPAASGKAFSQRLNEVSSKGKSLLFLPLGLPNGV